LPFIFSKGRVKIFSEFVGISEFETIYISIVSKASIEVVYEGLEVSSNATLWLFMSKTNLFHKNAILDKDPLGRVSILFSKNSLGSGANSPHVSNNV
jgi:hypothetical protein